MKVVALLICAALFTVYGLRHERNGYYRDRYHCQNKNGDKVPQYNYAGTFHSRTDLCSMEAQCSTGSDEWYCEDHKFVPECNEVLTCDHETGYCQMLNVYGEKQFDNKCHCVERNGKKECPDLHKKPDDCNIVLSEHVNLNYAYNGTVDGRLTEGSTVVASCDFVNEELIHDKLEWTEQVALTCENSVWKTTHGEETHIVNLNEFRCVLNRETSCNNSELSTLYLNNTCYVFLMDKRRTWQEALNHCKHIEWYKEHEYRQPHLGFASTKERFDAIYAELQSTKYDGKFSWQAARLYDDGNVQRNESMNYTSVWIGLKTGPFRWRFSENSREIRLAEQPMWLDRESNHEQLDDCTYMQIMKFGDEPSGFRSSNCTEKRYALCQLFDEQ